MLRFSRSIVTACVAAVLVCGSARLAEGFAFVFADETLGVNNVTHSMGYNGTGGVLNISVGVDNTSVNAADMLIPLQNVVYIINTLTPTTQNLTSDFVNIPFGAYDFESVLLHEMGHALGLAHPNLASESGLTGSDRNYTQSTDGLNNSFDLNAGADGVIGSHDDIRGDDTNLNWFHKATNDPFDTANALGVVDSTTYSRDLVDLPGTDTFSTNPDRDVAGLARYNEALTEGVMQQGTFNNEIQRTLGADDVAGLKYAMSGIDELAGTADDYTINLIYNGLVNPGDANTDIIVDFDNGLAAFAITYIGASGIAPDHLALTSASIYFNDTFDWYFVPEPSTMLLAATGGLLMLRRKRQTA